MYVASFGDCALYLLWNLKPEVHSGPPLVSCTCWSGNIAFGKPTEQSSTMKASSKAVDGDDTTGSFTHTQDDPWWRVDLQAQHLVKVVRVTNRNQAGGRLDLFTIKVGNHICGSNLVVPQGETGDFICEGGPSFGSNVTIQLYGINRKLTVGAPPCAIGAHLPWLVLTVACSC